VGAPFKPLYLGAIAGLLALAGPAAAEDPAGTVPPDQSQSMAKDSGPIMVSTRPVEVLAGPSPSASVLYGFPAGRPFRLIGREGGFAHIQDLKSSATGWIDNPAVAEAPAEATSAPYAPQQNPTMTSPQQSSAQQPGRQGLLGGFLGGLFGGQ
jgi:hypothetical protein